MRLLERTRVKLEIAPRVQKKGALGGLEEAFSDNRTACWGSVLPQKGGFEAQERGACAREALRVLVPLDAAVRVGDGLWAEGKPFVVQSVRRWTAHLEVDCEAVS